MAGLSAGYVIAEPGNEDMRQGVLTGRYQLVFISPESLLNGLLYFPREVTLTPQSRQNFPSSNSCIFTFVRNYTQGY